MIALSDIRVVQDVGAPEWDVELHQDQAWTQARITNMGAPTRVREIILQDFGPFSPYCRFYGEGFQMLSQYTGRLSSPRCLTPYSDREHCRIPQKEDGQTVYGLLHIEVKEGDHVLLCFGSCRRFVGEFRITPEGSIQAVLNMEGLEAKTGDAWTLEEIGFLRGSDADALYDQLAQRLAKNHQPRNLSEIPTGWCSWYCYGPNLRQEDIRRNLRAIKGRSLPLQYIQIDDGFQAKMGDWDTWSTGFPEGISSLITDIRDAGCEPAIWLAPFIAEAGSEILSRHPEWFISDSSGDPLASDQVSFGGWRAGPWYCLDGSNVAVQDHLAQISGYFRKTFGIKYFKLDALFWGAMHGGNISDAQFTRIEAYRAGMSSFNRGAGDDAFILGCNAPMWPSLGLVNGMRVTGDIVREGETIRSLGEQQFFRNWQHRKIWINDPDCLCLDDGDITFPKKEELSESRLVPANTHDYHYHAAVVFASGGAVLSGDDLISLSDVGCNVLRKIISGPKKAARFAAFNFSEGYIYDNPRRSYRAYFNPTSEVLLINLNGFTDQSVKLLWNDNGAGVDLINRPYESTLRIEPGSAAIIVCEVNDFA